MRTSHMCPPNKVEYILHVRYLNGQVYNLMIYNIIMEETWHGTYSGYTNHSCRCEKCSEASRTYKAKWSKSPTAKANAKQKRQDSSITPQVHGTRSSYINYGCRCIECLNANRDYHAVRNYGLMPGDYMRMYNEQGGLCAICGNPPGAKGLSVDHCHKPGGQVRGLLCGNCNTAIGLMYESIDTLTSAIKYLTK